MNGDMITIALERDPVNGPWAALGAILLLVFLGWLLFGKGHH